MFQRSKRRRRRRYRRWRRQQWQRGWRCGRRAERDGSDFAFPARHSGIAAKRPFWDPHCSRTWARGYVSLAWTAASAHHRTHAPG